MAEATLATSQTPTLGCRYNFKSGTGARLELRRQLVSSTLFQEEVAAKHSKIKPRSANNNRSTSPRVDNCLKKMDMLDCLFVLPEYRE
jgi:hypothetical protein